MKQKIICTLVFCIGIIIGSWFGINRVVVEFESIPSKSFFDLLSLTLSFGGFIFSGLSFVIAYNVFSEWKLHHKKELLMELKTESIDRMLKCYTALSVFSYHNACKDTSVLFSNSIFELQSVTMRYFSMISSKEVSTVELLACNINNDRMQLVKDYSSLMAHIYNAVKVDSALIDHQFITFPDSNIENNVRKRMLEVSMNNLGIKLSIQNGQLDLKKLSGELYLCIIDNSGELVAQAYSNDDRI